MSVMRFGPQGETEAQRAANEKADTAMIDAMTEQPKKGRVRHCWNCGADMGFIEDAYYDRGDTCGRSECEREARREVDRERDDAHERLDRDMGW